MVKNIFKWLRGHYFLIVNSIAFYPIIIAICFLLLAIGLIQFDYSETGKNFKAGADWLSLKDSNTARTIIATVAGGILSLAVFSFSMVMILLNQAASNMSNRILDGMIGNKFHQLVLGFYIGTIVYAFFLLSTIRDIDSGLYIPSISIYLLIFVTIIDIFLFIYFLHYITRSVKYETIINNIHKITYKSLQEYYTEEYPTIPEQLKACSNNQDFLANKSGYFNGFAHNTTVSFCAEHDIYINFLYAPGTYVLKDTPIANISSTQPLTDEQWKYLTSFVDIFDLQNNIATTPYLGCRHLAEVSIKALSPGINDPGTAIISLNCLGNLLAYRVCHHPRTQYADEHNTHRITVKEYSFKDFFTGTLYPVWDYGKNDRMLQNSLHALLVQLIALNSGNTNLQLIQHLLNDVTVAIQVQQHLN